MRGGMLAYSVILSIAGVAPPITAPEIVAFTFRERAFVSHTWTLSEIGQTLADALSLPTSPNGDHFESFGLVWASGTENFAVAANTAWKEGADCYWIRRAESDWPFMFSTTLAGRTRGFKWFGIAHNAVIVDRLGAADPIVLHGLHRYEKYVKLALDPSAAFAGLAGVPFGEPVDFKDRGRTRMFSRSSGTGWDISLHIEFGSEERIGLPVSWLLVTQSQTSPIALVRFGLIEQVFDNRFALPSEPRAVLSTYARATKLPGAAMEYRTAALERDDGVRLSTPDAPPSTTRRIGSILLLGAAILLLLTPTWIRSLLSSFQKGA
jgi:hypothetical protein